MSAQSSNDVKSTVTVVGLGPMGRALASALLDADVAVTVWNRTSSKADELVARGATLAPSPAAAMHAGDLTIFCMLDDNVVTEVIREAARHATIAGVTLVNLTADSPTRTRELADYLQSFEVAYIDGAIMTPAATIGTDAARILFAGPQRVYDSHREVFSAFGGTSHYLGSDIGSAATYDVALLSLFWTSFVGVVQSLALTKAEGIDLAGFTDHAVAMSQLVVELLPGLAADFAEQRFSGADSASIESMAASLTHLRAAFVSSGVSTEVLDSISAVADSAKLAGHGEDAPILLAKALIADGQTPSSKRVG